MIDGIETQLPLPEYITFNNDSVAGLFWTVLNNNQSTHGTKLKIVTRVDVWDAHVKGDNTTNSEFVWYLEMFYYPYYPPNVPPYLLVEPPVITLLINKTKSYTILPSHYSNDTVSVKVNQPKGS